MPSQNISQQELNQMGVRGSKITRRSSPVPSDAEVEAAEPPPSAPAPVDNSIPMASMAASMGVINQQLAAVVEQNSIVIESFRAQAQEKVVSQPRLPWRATVVRDRSTKLIDYVDIIPLEK